MERITMGGRKLHSHSFTDEENKFLVKHLDEKTQKELEKNIKCSVKIDKKLVTRENIKEFEK